MFSDGNDGAGPGAGVVFGTDGALHGGAGGGRKRRGIIFRLTSTTGQWKETVPYEFSSDTYGYSPAVSRFDSSGDLLGTTNVDPSNHLPGTVFQLVPGDEGGQIWAFDLLHGFRGVPDGAMPAAGLVFGQGSVYGTTQQGGQGTGCGNSGCGSVFSVKQ